MLRSTGMIDSLRRNGCLPSALAVTLLVSCGGDRSPDPHISRHATWSLVLEELPGALISGSGVDEDDNWFAGGDPDNGDGATVVHYDGQRFERHDVGVDADLWWVRAFDSANVYFGGSSGTIIHYDGSNFELLDTPGDDTVFGLWGPAPDDLWAVGGNPALAEAVAFVWRYDGSTWQVADGLPEPEVSSYFKVWGTGPDDVRIVGADGTMLRYDGETFTELERVTDYKLLTVHANAAGTYAAVGGLANAVVLEDVGEGWTDVTPKGDYKALLGVWLTQDGGYAVGSNGEVLTRDLDQWKPESLGNVRVAQELHAVWVAPNGSVWVVGGDLASKPLSNGVLLHKGNLRPSASYSP
jgi:hypothetical protein